MLRTAQAQSEEEQLRHALEASCNTAAAAAAEADIVRQAIAESLNVAAGRGAAAADTGKAGGDESAAGIGKDNSATRKHAGAIDEEEELKRVLAISGIDVEWEKPPPELAGGTAGGPGVGQRFGLESEEFHEDAELREAIKASLAGDE